MAFGAGKPAQLRVDVDVDTDKARTGFNNLGGIVTGITAGVTASITGMITSGLSQVGQMALDFATDVINAGLAADDALDHLERVFQGTAQDIILAWSGVAPQTFGVLASEFQEFATKFGRVLTNMGIDQTTAANLVVETASLAADMAETYGITWEQAFDALSNAALGKFKGIQQFTGTIGDQMVNDAIAALGAVPDGATDAEKVEARLHVVFDKLGGVVGAYKDDLNDADGAARLAMLTWEQMKEDIGKELLPVLAELTPTIKEFTDFLITHKDTILQFAGLMVWLAEQITRGVEMSIIAFTYFQAAWTIAGEVVTGTWNVIVGAFKWGVGIISSLAGIVGNIINAVIGAIRTLINILGRLPFISGIGSIIGALNPFDSSRGFGAFSAVTPTQFAPLTFAPATVAGTGSAQPLGTANVNVFGGVDPDQIVAALARYTRRTASLTQAGIRIA